MQAGALKQDVPPGLLFPIKKEFKMATKAGVGESKERDAFAAGVEAARAACAQAGINKCDFVLLFASADYNHQELLRGVRSVTGSAPLSGCSGEGIITQRGPSGEGTFTQSGLVKGQSSAGVMVFSSDKIRFFNCFSQGLKENSEKAGEELGRKIREYKPENPIALMLFPDGLTVNTKALFRGIDSKLEKPILFTGGAAADNVTYTQTYQYFNDQVLVDSVPCVLLSGEAGFQIGVNHGCLPIGLDKTVTKAERNKIFEIDGKPAWDFFKPFLDDDLKDFTPEIAASLSLGEKLPDVLATEYDKYIIWIPLGKDPDGALSLSTEIATGTKVRITRRDPEKISSGAKHLAERLKAKLGNKKPVAILQFDCAARGTMIFGEDAKVKGIDVMQDVFGKDVPWLGFYTYGEIAPIGGKNYPHTCTAVLCVMY
jgi:hypothetical protein